LRRPGEGNGLHQPRRPPAAGHRQRPFVRTTPVAAPDHVPVPHPDLDQAMVMVARQGQKTVARVLFINTQVLHSTSHRTRPHPNLPHPAHRQATRRKGVAFYVAPTTWMPPITTLPQPTKGQRVFGKSCGNLACAMRSLSVSLNPWKAQSRPPPRRNRAS